MAADPSLARFFAGPPLPFVTAWRHRTDPVCPPHAHECVEIVYHRRGRGTTAGAAGTIAFGEGSVVVHPPLMPHDQRIDGAGEDVCVHLRATRPLPTMLRRPLHIAAVDDPWLRGEIEGLADAPLAAGAQANALAADALAARLLSLRATAVLAALVRIGPSVPPAGDRTDDGVMAAARRYLAERYRESIAVADVARHVALSPDHLRHRFAHAHGMGLVAWLHALRVARAKELLAHAPLPLAEIARLCGFGTDRYLSEIFRRETGMTPGAYRKRWKADGGEGRKRIADSG